MIQDIIFRVIPSLLCFGILPLLSYILLVYLRLPAAVRHQSKCQSITLGYFPSPSPPAYQISFLFISASPLPLVISLRAILSPSCTVHRPPSSRHSSLRSFTVFSFSLSHCQLQGYHITSVSILSVCCLFPSVCL